MLTRKLYNEFADVALRKSYDGIEEERVARIAEKTKVTTKCAQLSASLQFVARTFD